MGQGELGIFIEGNWIEKGVYPNGREGERAVSWREEGGMLTPLPFEWGVKNLGVCGVEQFSMKPENMRHFCPSSKRRERMSLSF